MAKTATKNAVKTSDMKVAVGNYFSTLDLPTLHRVADHFGAEQEDSIEEQILALAEMGVTYKLYAQAFKIPLPDDYVEELDEVAVDEPTEEEQVTQESPILGTRSLALQPQSEYLIKMTRANPYFEVGRYRFTQEHPYNIMDAKTAQYVLEQEEGFRQAFPDELREYYAD